MSHFVNQTVEQMVVDTIGLETGYGQLLGTTNLAQ